MSDSTPVIDQLSTASANIPIRFNETADALSPSSLYGRHASACSGLTWGYYGGRFNSSAIASGTVALTASATNYLVASRASGAVSLGTLANWNDSGNYIRLYLITAGASSVTSYEDHRQALAPPAFSGGTLTSALNEAPTVTLASAATVAIGAAAANTVQISGTTTITAFDTIAAGAIRRLEFQGALTLTHNATSLILPGAASITTAAGDVAEFQSLGAGNWRCDYYSKASGSPIAIASATLLGGVKVGAGLAVAGDGTLSASGSAPATQTLTDFANAAGTTTGLTYGYQAGVIRQDNVTTSVAAGTVALTASTTNYVEITGAGVVSANTVGFTSGRYPLATVVTGASTITTITDKRGVISLLPPSSIPSETVNAQTATTYAIATGDKGFLVTRSNAAAMSDTLPQAGASFPNGWWCDYVNRGAGTVTLTPTTSTIDGAASLVLTSGQGVRIVSDGVNYFTNPGKAPPAATMDKARMYRNAAFTTGTVAVKVPMDTVSYDTNSITDTVNGRITPKRAGYYLVVGRASAAATTSGQRAFPAIYKNGAEVSRGADVVSSAVQGIGAPATDVIYFNGTTDYVEAWIYTSVALSLEPYSFTSFLTVEGPLP